MNETWKEKDKQTKVKKNNVGNNMKGGLEFHETDKRQAELLGLSCNNSLCGGIVSQFSRSVLSDSSIPWTAASQVSLSNTNSWSLLKLMSIKLVMPSNHLILCHPLLFLPSIFPSIRVFSNESVLCIRWPKYWTGIEWGLNSRDI